METGQVERVESRQDAERKTGQSVVTVTNVLIALNVLVYVAMVLNRVSPVSPTPFQAVEWGADYGPLTIGAGQWWRMFTSCFVHFGIVHLGFNMYVLYQVGPFITALFGRVRYLLIYLLAGLAGSLVSLWFHPQVVSAGASGAIFGLYGAVFGFLLINRRVMAPEAVKGLARWAGLFVVYNVAFGGVIGGVDLAAHLGGLVAGFLGGLGLAQVRRA